LSADWLVRGRTLGANLVQVFVSAADRGPEADRIESDAFKSGMSIEHGGNVPVKQDRRSGGHPVISRILNYIDVRKYI
jgi:hypothetical protein